MLRRSHRFHGRGGIKAVYQRGQAVRGPQITLKYGSRGPHKPYRVAIVVSRKVSKSAVVRNRIRRRIYETIRLQESAIKPGTDLVVTVFGEQLADIPAPRLQKIIAALLEKTV